LGTGNPNGTEWMPAEVDVPIRFLQWFWLPNNDANVAPPEVIMRWYYQSVGRNTNLLLGLVIDNQGLIPDFDVTQLEQFGQLLKNRFSNSLQSISGKGNNFEISFDSEQQFNTIMIQEDLAFGHRVREFIVEITTSPKSNWKEIFKGTAIGHKFLWELPNQNAQFIRLRIVHSEGEPQIKTFALFNLAHLDWD